VEVLVEGKKVKKRLPQDVGLGFGGIRLPRLELPPGPPRLDQGSMVVTYLWQENQI